VVLPNSKQRIILKWQHILTAVQLAPLTSLRRFRLTDSLRFTRTARLVRLFPALLVALVLPSAFYPTFFATSEYGITAGNLVATTGSGLVTTAAANVGVVGVALETALADAVIEVAVPLTQ